MNPTVVLSAYGVANFPAGGGHFWVYMQYALGLRRNGCEVFWMERFTRSGDEARDAAAIATFFERMESFGFGGRAILTATGPDGAAAAPETILGATRAEVDALIRRADLVLNFHYAIEPGLLARFRRSALVDIDPGLFQFWLSRGQLTVPRHDHYFTTGETVGRSPWIPDCGLPWVHIRPCVSLDHWKYEFDPDAGAMTAVSAWDSSDWIVDGEVEYENTKRVAFLPFRALPEQTPQPLELALFLRTERDEQDRGMMERHGWRIRDSRDVAGSPAAYRSYIRSSRGEIGCAKPSCMKFQNAWVSDRTLCYLASGKPVVVQDTGPSRHLPNGEGMFRFTTVGGAVESLAAMNADYERHSRAARALAEAHFDARKVAARILEVTLG
jgi:hypothetical protein